MKHLNTEAKFSATAESKGFLDFLKKEEIFSRAIDAYACAAAYAIKNNAEISQELPRRSKNLAEVFRLDKRVRLALESGLYAVRKHNRLPETESEEEVFELISKYAETGLRLLKNRWKGKTKNQIQSDIQKIISS